MRPAKPCPLYEHQQILYGVEPYYLGFKQLKIGGVTLSRPEPAQVPAEMSEYREMMDEERRRYIKDS